MPRPPWAVDFIESDDGTPYADHDRDPTPKHTYLYEAGEGQNSIVEIKLTGSRGADLAAANEAGGCNETPNGYTWQHVDDFDPQTENFVHGIGAIGCPSGDFPAQRLRSTNIKTFTVFLTGHKVEMMSCPIRAIWL